MKQIILFLLLITSGAALADPNTPTRLSQLKAELSNVQQEQQSVYQNYQMVKEMRRLEVEEGNSPPITWRYDANMDNPLPNYDDVVRAQQEREKRIQQYTSDLSQLFARFLELENQRKSTRRNIQELEQHPSQ